ncbi:hypothetical protein L2E82_41095 [Cichorium intybus]|uniref:Uncharacterized protein n=1 Tax=Cichorium intybus TaxID=13427 RepID=A0ACB9ANH4_CICIN|nr:hypothetical protein L2E82_41095 [Cichorium intybus]
MAHNSKSLLLVKLAFFGAIVLYGSVSATRSITTSDPVNGVGAWDLEKHYLEELGKYAVAAHNLGSQHKLTFQKVITCDPLSHSHSHKLTLAATDHGVTHTYEAVVAYKPWAQFKKLISFKIC